MAKRERVGIVNFHTEVRSLLNEYGAFAHETIDELVPEAANIAVKMIRANSAKRTGAYARDWAKKRVPTWGYGSSYIVYNKKHYRLAHLLEKPHEKENKYGKYGKTEGDHVIKDAEEYSKAWLINMVSAKLEGGK